MRRSGFVLLVLLCGGGEAFAAELLVPEEYASIESALGAAACGDTVSLAAGTYYEHDLWLPPGVSLLGRSGHGESVLIDAMAQGRVLEGEDLVAENRIERLTLRNGFLDYGHGVGFRAEGSPRLYEVVIEDNSTGSGDGIGMHSLGQPMIESTVFRRNRGQQGSIGGGVRLNGFAVADPVLRNVTFIENVAGTGGAIFITGHEGILSGLKVVGNSAWSNGGGIFFNNMGSDGLGPELTDSFFMENSAHYGGGIYAQANVIIRNCTVVGNFADPGGGGGIYGGAPWDYPTTPQIINCIVAFNTGGGIGLRDWPLIHVECCDVFGNVGGNYVGSQPDWTGSYGNISEDPLFCESADPWDYSIYDTSPCTPAGNSCEVLMGAFDVGCLSTVTVETSWSCIKSLY